MSSSSSLVAAQHQPRLQLQQRRDQHDELGRGLEVELAALLEVVEVGEHDLGELQLEQVDLFAQHERQQQVERAAEDVEVELERGEGRHLRRCSAGCSSAHRSGRRRRASGSRAALRGAPTPIRSRTSASVAAAIALRARGAVARGSPRARASSARSCCVALAHRRQVVDHGGRDRRLELAVARLRELGFDRRRVDAAHRGEDFDQVADAGLLGRAAHLAAGVGDRALELLLDRRRARRARTRCPARCRPSWTSCASGPAGP